MWLCSYRAGRRGRRGAKKNNSGYSEHGGIQVATVRKDSGDLILLKEKVVLKRGVNPHVTEKIPLSSVIETLKSDDKKHSSLWNSTPRDVEDTRLFLRNKNQINRRASLVMRAEIKVQRNASAITQGFIPPK